MRFILLTLVLLFYNNISSQSDVTYIAINHSNLDSISHDFHKNWEYQEGIYLNKWNQLSCDGFCPVEADGLKDSLGRIPDNLLDSMYSILDTTHQFQTLQGNTNCYEMGESKYIYLVHSEMGIHLDTYFNISAHSLLHLTFDSDLDSLMGSIEYNSIRSQTKTESLRLKSGNFTMDPDLYDKGIFKAVFDLRFHNHIEPTKEIFWKGIIYLPIQ